MISETKQDDEVLDKTIDSDAAEGAYTEPKDNTGTDTDMENDTVHDTEEM